MYFASTRLPAGPRHRDRARRAAPGGNQIPTDVNESDIRDQVELIPMKYRQNHPRRS